MAENIPAVAEAPADPHRITLCKIREWGACTEGREWFRRKLPNGGSYAETLEALLADGRRSDAAWLDAKVLNAWGTDAGFMARAVADQIRIITAAAGEPDP